jgi:predicted ATP-dependent endonuclease of OLD family
MRLTKISAEKLRSFGKRIDIDIDAKVTILTGANDAGKSSVLRALRILLLSEPATEHDVNRDHLLGSNRVWSGDTAYWVEGSFELHRKDELLGITNYEVS